PGRNGCSSAGSTSTCPGGGGVTEPLMSDESRAATCEESAESPLGTEKNTSRSAAHAIERAGREREPAGDEQRSGLESTHHSIALQHERKFDAAPPCGREEGTMSSSQSSVKHTLA